MPTGIAPTSLVECPICEAEFLLASVAPRAIPKVRVVEHEPTPEGKATTAGLSPQLGIVVDDAETSTEDKLSRLMRSAASWQLPGVHQPHDEDVAAAEEAETDDEEHSSLNLETADERIIPNDHAPAAAKFGATLDAAYRDADPELAADPSTPADELQLAGSRLDQLLSDLMKPQTVAASTPIAASIQAREEAPSSPEFAELVENDAAEEETTRFEPQATVQDADLEDHSDSFDDRWRRLHASPEQAAEDDDGDVEYVDEEAAAEDEFAALDLRTTPRRKRRPSAVRTLVGIVGGGAIGILGGAYALLWLRDPDLDLMGMANWLPPVMLPSSMQTPTESSLAEQGLLAPPAAVDQQAAGNDFETPAPPLSSTLEIAEPADELGAGPTNDQVVDATEVGSSAATPAEHDPIRQDPDFMPAGATEPVADAGVAPTVENAVAQSPVTATTHWPTTPIVGQLRGAKFYSIAELDATLPGADAAHRRFLAGDLARKEDVAAMGQAYIELCKLAEQFTLTNPAEYGNELITKQMNAKNIFRGAVGDPARRNDLAMIAGRWLQHNRRPNQGVVVLGKVTDLEAHGSWTEYTIETPLGDATATSKVLLEGIPFASGSDVAVVGTIVADPRQAIDGYAGEAPQVIVAGFAFVPQDFVAPKIGGVSGEAGDLFSLGE
ncbi:MAG: hypothetical protein C0485_06840 [Pirellula sp.]|nr:hypothetical protein [Pirellula sp.]